MGRFLVILALVLAASSAARAQDWSEYEQQSRAARLAIFDLPRAEDVARSGGQTVRIYVDGAFTGLLPAVVLDRPADGRPRLTVISGRRQGGRWSRIVRSVPIPDTLWSSLFADATEAVTDWRALEAKRENDKAHPPPSDSLGEILVCNDGQSSMVELADHGQVFRAAEHDCEFTELGDFASELAGEAVQAMPDCAAIGPVVTEHDPLAGLKRLELCSLMSGDRTSATAVVRALLRENARDLAPVASPGIVADWPGRARTVGGKAFERLWSEVTASLGPHFVIARVVGQSSGRAVAYGTMTYLPQGDDVRYQRAPCVQVWAKTRAGWRITRLKVGAFTPFDMPHDPRTFT